MQAWGATLIKSPIRTFNGTRTLTGKVDGPCIRRWRRRTQASCWASPTPAASRWACSATWQLVRAPLLYKQLEGYMAFWSVLKGFFAATKALYAPADSSTFVYVQASLITCAGVLAGTGAGYQCVWAFVALLYFSSAAVWHHFVWGQPLSL